MTRSYKKTMSVHQWWAAKCDCGQIMRVFTPMWPDNTGNVVRWFVRPEDGHFQMFDCDLTATDKNWPCAYLHVVYLCCGNCGKRVGVSRFKRLPSPNEEGSDLLSHTGVGLNPTGSSNA